jgi:5'-methylthioadenosine phosphorylase
MSNVLAVVGGSGLYALETLSGIEQVEVMTPFGAPSAPITRGTLGDTTLLFLPRHGVGHRFSPTEVNYRANICALKKLGATHLISISAVGSLRESLRPGDFVIVDQYIDRTQKRASTFFEGGIVAHVSLADPVCPLLAKSAVLAARRVGATVHEGGTYICIEGPQFSTRAESLMYRSFQADVIGMTAMPEVRLAREAELPYVTIACVTDYDCWHQSEEAVTVEQVIAVLQKNVSYARQLVVELVKDLRDPRESPAYGALKNAIISDSRLVAECTDEKLRWLLDLRH